MPDNVTVLRRPGQAISAQEGEQEPFLIAGKTTPKLKHKDLVSIFCLVDRMSRRRRLRASIQVIQGDAKKVG